MILLSCCTEMEIKEGSLIGLFLTDWGRYFQALGSFWHRGSAAKLPFFLRIMDWIVEWIPTKHFQHDHILKGWDLSVASLREIGTAGRTLCDQYVFVYLFFYVFVYFFYVFVFFSVYFWLFYMSYSSSRAGHSHSNLESGKSFLNSWKLGRSESQPTRLHITLASNLDKMKRIEKDFEKLK